MARFRPTEHCFKCGKPLKEIHRKVDGVFFGDTFLRHEHDGECNEESEEFSEFKQSINLLHDVARCINSKCTIKHNCKRHIDHHKPMHYWRENFTQQDDGSCANQIPIKTESRSE